MTDHELRQPFIDRYEQEANRTRRRLILIPLLLIAALIACTPFLARLKAHTESPEARPATWNGVEWVCPSGSDIWVDETQARAGVEPFAYCVSQP